MLYDRESLSLIKCASKEPSRFAINGLQLELGGETAATDGSVLVVLNRGSADPKEFASVKGGMATPGEKGVILDADMVKEIAKLIPKGAMLRALNHAALTKCDDKEVEFTTHDGARQRRIAEPPVEGKFPDYRSILKPLYNEECVIFHLNAERLKLIAETVLSTTHTGRGSSIEFRVPLDNTRPVLFRAPNVEGSHHRVLVGAVMPVKPDDHEFKLTKWEEEFIGIENLREPFRVENEQPEGDEA